MKQISYLNFSFLIIFAIFIIHIFATIYFLYWIIPWLDILMHILGGAFVGLIILYIYYQSTYVEPRHFSKIFVFLLVLSSTALIGVLWEFFEFFIDEYVAVSGWLTLIGGVRDTLEDLFFNLVGSIASAIIFITTWKKNLN